MSLIFESSAASNPARRELWLRLLACELNPPLPGLSLSPCREPLWCSPSEPGRRSKPPEGAAGAVAMDEQKLRLSHKAPQFCSHCSRTLLIIASFTSSPQLSKMFTSSTYGLGKRHDSGQSWRETACICCSTCWLNAAHYYPLQCQMKRGASNRNERLSPYGDDVNTTTFHEPVKWHLTAAAEGHIEHYLITLAG